VKRALEALADFRFDVEFGETREVNYQPAHLDKSQPRPQARTVRMQKVKLVTGGFATEADFNADQGEDMGERAVRDMAAMHLEGWWHARVDQPEPVTEEQIRE